MKEQICSVLLKHSVRTGVIACVPRYERVVAVVALTHLLGLAEAVEILKEEVKQEALALPEGACDANNDYL